MKNAQWSIDFGERLDSGWISCRTWFGAHFSRMWIDPSVSLVFHFGERPDDPFASNGVSIREGAIRDRY
tara:strand:+ start:567 stop:773 length:207 start_codon:yes stop_codon:yes gene_type:complete